VVGVTGADLVGIETDAEKSFMDDLEQICNMNFSPSHPMFEGSLFSSAQCFDILETQTVSTRLKTTCPLPVRASCSSYRYTSQLGWRLAVHSG